MHGAAQQVEQGFFVVFACGLQGVQALGEFGGEGVALKAAFKHGVAAEFVNHAWVAGEVARGPAGHAQQLQQALVYQRVL